MAELVHSAAQWGLQTMVARLVEEDPALVNAANEYGWTCLMLACSRGHAALAAWLLDHGARVDQGDLDGFTALTHAACGRQGRREVVSLLLRRGADPNARGRWGSTALMEAASLELVPRIEALLEAPVPPIASAAAAAAAAARAAARGVSDEEEEGVMEAAPAPAVAAGGGMRPLDIDAQDAKGSTALFKACLYGRVEAARLLLAAGADPTIANLEGMSPMLATLAGRHRLKGRLIASMLERAMLEPCRVRYLRKARFGHEAAGFLIVPSSSSSSSSSSLPSMCHEEEEAAAPFMVVAAFAAAADSAASFQAARRARHQPLPCVVVEASATSTSGSASNSSSRRKRATPGALPLDTDQSRPWRPLPEPAASLEVTAAVARHVVSGGLAPELFEELMGMLTVRWDPSRRGQAVAAEEIERSTRGMRSWVEGNRGEVARLGERRRQRRRGEAAWDSDGSDSEYDEGEVEEEDDDDDHSCCCESEAADVTTGDEEDEEEEEDDDEMEGEEAAGSCCLEEDARCKGAWSAAQRSGDWW